MRSPIPQLKRYEMLLTEPLLIEHGCKMIFWGAGGGAAKLIWELLPFESITFKLPVVGALGGAVGYAADTYFEKRCERYKQFQMIDISKPANLDTLVQFGKHMIYHTNSYVVVNRSCHHHSHKKIATMKQHAFSRDFSDQSIDFNFILCETETNDGYESWWWIYLCGLLMLLVLFKDKLLDKLGKLLRFLAAFLPTEPHPERVTPPFLRLRPPV